MYIPQFTEKTASLNVAIAGSIIFHHFGLWAGYQESQRTGFKYGDGNENKGKDERYESQVFFVDYLEDGTEAITTELDRIRA